MIASYIKSPLWHKSMSGLCMSELSTAAALLFWDAATLPVMTMLRIFATFAILVL